MMQEQLTPTERDTSCLLRGTLAAREAHTLLFRCDCMGHVFQDGCMAATSMEHSSSPIWRAVQGAGWLLITWRSMRGTRPGDSRCDRSVHHRSCAPLEYACGGP